MNKNKQYKLKNVYTKDELFRLTEESVKEIRCIRLNKKASYAESELNKVSYNKVNRSGHDFLQFYSLGFYDALTCIKPKELTSVTHKEHFLLSNY